MRIACINYEPVSNYRKKWSTSRLADYYNPAAVAEIVQVFCPQEEDRELSSSVRVSGFQSFRDLRKKCEAFRPDILRCYEAFRPFPDFALMLSFLMDVPSYLSLHDSRVPRPPFLAGFTTITAYTEPLADAASRELRRKVEVQLNGVDSEQFRPRRPVKIDPRVANAKHRLFTIIRPDPVKNVSSMVEATSILAKRLGSVAHVLAGPGSEAIGFDGTHLGLGAASEEVVCDYLNWCSSFLQVQLVADVGIAATEALMVGRPVVLAGDAVGNAAHVVDRDNGQLVPLDKASDPEAISTAVERCLKTRYDADLIRRRAINTYSEGVLRRQEADRYEKLMRGTQNPNDQTASSSNGVFYFRARLSFAAWRTRKMLRYRLREAARGAYEAYSELARTPIILKPAAAELSLVPSAEPPGANRDGQELSPPARALRWLAARADEWPKEFESANRELEASLPGDTVRTLLEYGERDAAARVASRLIQRQAVDGKCDGTHDAASSEIQTARALRGLLVCGDLVPQSFAAADRACKYLTACLRKAQAKQHVKSRSGAAPATSHLCLVPPLYKAAEVLDRPEYGNLAEERLDSYLKAPEGAPPLIGPRRFSTCELRALIELEQSDLVQEKLEELSRRQRKSGAVPTSRGSARIYAAGLAELAICLYKTGRSENADKILAWLERYQRRSGGFRESYGFPTRCSSGVEDPRAAKFYLDANRHRVLAFRNRHPEIPAEMPLNDGRARSILSLIHPGDRIVEVGCGKGRYLKAIRQVYPDTECTGVDISKERLAGMPAEIQAVKGSLECVPCAGNSFDLVFSVEAIEHSANPEAAVAELIRVARPAAWIAIIDKQQGHWGRQERPAWVRGPKAEYLRGLLERGCESVTIEPTGYGDHPADGSMLVWRGRKRSA